MNTMNCPMNCHLCGKLIDGGNVTHDGKPWCGCGPAMPDALFDIGATVSSVDPPPSFPDLWIVFGTYQGGNYAMPSCLHNHQLCDDRERAMKNVEIARKNGWKNLRIIHIGATP